MPRHSSLNPTTPDSTPETCRVTILDDQLHALQEVARELDVDGDDGVTTEALDHLIEAYTDENPNYSEKNGLLHYHG